MINAEDDSRDFITIYKRDYLGKKTEKATEHRPLLSYPPPLNILNGPYKQYLNTRGENQSLPKNERSEDPIENLNGLRDKFPHLRKVLPRIVPDENVIEYEKVKSRKTMYQSDYSKEFDEYPWLRLKHLDKDFSLPQNWFIPETIQRRAYRNPWQIATKNLVKPSKVIIPCNNLDPNPKEREILNVTTGNSEYVNTIGIAGEKIMLQGFSEHIKSQSPLRSSGISVSLC